MRSAALAGILCLAACGGPDPTLVSTSAEPQAMDTSHMGCISSSDCPTGTDCLFIQTTPTESCCIPADAIAHQNVCPHQGL